jgi:hypothetical protein
MNKLQKNHHRQQSRLAAASYIAAAECIGKQFAFGSHLYRVIQHHPERWTFTCELVNAFNQQIEKKEAFVRHHCTPPQPREVSQQIPEREGVARYSSVITPNISDKTQLGIAADADGDKMKQPELTTIHFNTTLDVCSDVMPETTSAVIGEVATPLDPAHYIGQKFVWATEDGTTFNVTVQAYNESRKQFRLYEPRGGCWYREPEFVHEHCQPAAAPVVREPLPELIKIDPRRFWNLVSLSDKRQFIAADVQATGVPQADPLLQCACCGQHVTIIGKQSWSPKMNRKDSIMVECRNEDCIAHRRTATTESHHQICEDAKREVATKEQAS